MFVAAFVHETHAQLGFCQGNRGDPIFTEDFGSGTVNGPPLPVGTTTYAYVPAAPQDGQYTVSNEMGQLGSWHLSSDHTPGDTNGKAFIVNADFTAGLFYVTPITGLCENTSYEFSAWLMNVYDGGTNVCGNTQIPINVNFEIWDETDTVLLREGSTGDIFGTASPVWTQYGLTFRTLSGQNDVILKMRNNGDGGCGNDLAIDDIAFSTCGDQTVIVDANEATELLVCEDDTPVSLTLEANPDFSIYETHAYQWQQSNDGVTWNDIIGATDQTYTTPSIDTSQFFRVKVAEDGINLSNPLCVSLSDSFEVVIIPIPQAPMSQGDEVGCSDEALPVLRVTVGANETANWSDAPTGGTIVASQTTSYMPSGPGTFYVEAAHETIDCVSPTRTPISLQVADPPEVFDEEVILCSNGELTLDAGLDNVSYLWNTGETTRRITVATPGDYTVTVTDTNECDSTKEITVIEKIMPEIGGMVSDELTVIIEMVEEGEFEYSLDGAYYQDSPVFNFVGGGTYTAFARELNGCGTDTFSFFHLVIPKFFTPNNDGFNDSFVIDGVDLFTSIDIKIFDRYGKLLKNGPGADFSWDGTYNGQPLPASDYWYVIQLDEFRLSGHFTLKR